VVFRNGLLELSGIRWNQAELGGKIGSKTFFEIFENIFLKGEKWGNLCRD
jgi:hypothetical protein